MIEPVAFGQRRPARYLPRLAGLFRAMTAESVVMDPREIEALIDRVESLKVKQTEIEEMQRKMADQVGNVQKVIDAEQEMLRRIMRSNPPLNGPPAG